MRRYAETITFVYCLVSYVLGWLTLHVATWFWVGNEVILNREPTKQEDAAAWLLSPLMLPIAVIVKIVQLFLGLFREQ